MQLEMNAIAVATVYCREALISLIRLENYIISFSSNRIAGMLPDTHSK